MKNIKLLLLLIAVSTLTSACSMGPLGVPMLANVIGGHYQELTDTFEKEVGPVENWVKVGVDGGIPGLGEFQYLMIEICKAYVIQRKFGKAAECLKSFDKHMPYRVRLMDIASRTKEDLQYYAIRSRSIHTTLFLEIGNYKAAYEEGIRALGTKDYYKNEIIRFTDTMKLIADTAIAANQIGKNKKAQELINSLKLTDKNSLNFTISARDYIDLYFQQARVYISMGEYKKAKEKLNQPVPGFFTFERYLAAFSTLGIMELLGMGKQKNDPFDVNYYFMNTKLCFELKNYKCAIKGYNIIIDGDFKSQAGWFESKGFRGFILQSPKVTYIALYDRGRIYLSEGKNSKALKDFKRAIEIIESQRASLNTESSKIGFVGNKEDIYKDTVKLLVKLNRYEEAFVYAERGKARALIDILASKKSFGNKSDSSLVNKVSNIEATLAQSYGTGSEKSEAKKRSLILKKKNIFSLIKSELASLITVTSPDINELKRLLPENETLVEYYGDDSKMFAFILNKSGVEAVQINAKGLKEDISSFREAIDNPNSHAYKKYAQQLYSRLIRPVKKYLISSSVTIVPHGPLHYLPFNALINNNKFFIESYSLRILPSASVMKFLNKKRITKSSLLILGNPDLNDSSLDLPGAQAEAIAISKKHNDSHLLLRKNATETAVKAYGGSYKYLHFASHSVFKPEAPLESSLLLAKDSKNDGRLTVSELYNLDLNADLVTLSACETALGDIANGDDVVGFTRAFLFAGANSIVSSLWKVDDSATNKLMQAFYKNLASMGKRTALTSAQLAIKKDYKHPYYWAAFQLTGSI